MKNKKKEEVETDYFYQNLKDTNEERIYLISKT